MRRPDRPGRVRPARRLLLFVGLISRKSYCFSCFGHTTILTGGAMCELGRDYESAVRGPLLPVGIDGELDHRHGARWRGAVFHWLTSTRISSSVDPGEM